MKLKQWIKSAVAACVLAGTALCASLAQAQTPASILHDLRSNTQGYDAVVADAQAAMVNDRLLGYHSLQVENSRTFTVNFLANSAADRLAILSDDGCNVLIQKLDPNTGLSRAITYLSNKGVGQEFPNLGQSLHQLAFRPPSDASPTNQTSYTITVEYSNTIHTGTGDIDGMTLYAYTDGGAAPTPTPTPRPLTLNADRITDTSAHLYWTNSDAPNIQFYELFQGTTANFSPAPSNRIFQGKIPFEFTSSSLSPSTSYYYLLRLTYGPAGTAPLEARCTIKTLEADTPRLAFSGSLRACAGHLKDVPVHTASLTVKAQQRDPATHVLQPKPNTAFVLRFDGNSTDDKRAQFIKTVAGAAPQLADELPVTSDDQGNVSFTVLSSEKITRDIKVQAVWKDEVGAEHSAGNLGCDFAPVETRRHFGIRDFYQGFDQDTGWDFSSHLLLTPVVDASLNADAPIILHKGEVFLKFALNPAAAPEKRYFVINGVNVQTVPANNTRPVTLNGDRDHPLDASKFVPVAKHKLKILVATPTPNPDAWAAPRLGEATVYLCDKDGNPLSGTAIPTDPAQELANLETTVETNEKGVATFYFKTGPQVAQASELNFRVQEITQKP